MEGCGRVGITLICLCKQKNGGLSATIAWERKKIGGLGMVRDRGVNKKKSKIRKIVKDQPKQRKLDLWVPG